MKSITVVKENQEQKIFGIKEYSFIETKSEHPSLPIYRVIIKRHFDSELDVRYWFEEISDKIQFLSYTPSKLIKYIKEYEENIRFSANYLFHDLRTKYIDFLLYDEKGLQDNILLVGYTLLEAETCFAIKAFSLSGLAEFVNILFEYCNLHGYILEFEDYLRWIQLEQCILTNTNTNRNDIFDSFLKKTLQNEYCNIFLSAFNSIDTQGYIDKSFYNRQVKINGYSTMVNQVNQFTKYFSAFWKTDIYTKDASRTILCLHDELLNNESIEKVVYTIKPHLMQYYQLHWFEDFCSEIIRSISFPGLRIISSYAGRKFNFFQNNKPSDVREIDLILGVKYNEAYKIIAIECKKTLTIKEIADTNKKIKNKILKAYTNIIDAYIHIGCFNNDVEFDKNIPATSEYYKQSLIQIKSDPNVNDVPYFAFTISSIENCKLKMNYIMKHIFEQW